MINNIMWIEKAYSLSNSQAKHFQVLSSPILFSGNIVMLVTNNDNVH